MQTTAAEVVSPGVRLTGPGQSIQLHPTWLRERSTEPGQIDTTNRQRLYAPVEIAGDLAVTRCDLEVTLDAAWLIVAFSDGHIARLDLVAIERSIGWRSDPEEPPAPEPWIGQVDRFPYVEWPSIAGTDTDVTDDGMLEFLTAFYRHGFAVLRGAPTEPGTLHRVAARIGYISGNNFGWIFDVRAEPSPTDLAYTAIGLVAHTDQPYRRPVPGIQLLHCLVNDAPGGDSTLVDGRAAVDALASFDPSLYRALVDTEVEWRYDMGSDTVVGRGHIIDVDRAGRFRQIRFNTKLDEPVVTQGADLDGFYEARRWLTAWLNDPGHQLTFRLEPGDVMVIDNQRALHGRTEFDPTVGRRHLQGCYIDHDGPDTRYRLAVRRRASLSA